MNRFKRILVAANPGGFGSGDLRHVRELAMTNDAQVVFFDVVEPVPRWRGVLDVEGRTVDLGQMLLDVRREKLQQLVRASRITGAEAEVALGKPVVEIVRRVLSDECDLVIVGDPVPDDHGIPGLSSAVLQLLRKCPVPVWVMRPTRARKLRILALVDPDPGDAARDSLNDLVLELATSMAERRQGELHVAHAWSLPGEATLSGSPYVNVPERELQMMARAVAEGHQAHLQALVDRHGVAEAGGRVHLVKGEPGDVFEELADRHNINLVVLGTVARTGLSGHIMGNTAESVLRRLDCSVLAVKPEGFETPVRLDRRRRASGW